MYFIFEILSYKSEEAPDFWRVVFYGNNSKTVKAVSKYQKKTINMFVSKLETQLVYISAVIQFSSIFPFIMLSL